MAATAHADDRLIRCSAGSGSGLSEPVWEVDALANDRFVHMVLGLRADGSVSEATRTFLMSEILEISFDGDGSTVEVMGGSGLSRCGSPDPSAAS